MLPADPAPPIELRHVTKFYGRFAALRELSLSFAAGKLCGIFGGNGAGKSTLLRMVAGLSRPTRGEVLILGSADLRAVTAQVGYMGHAPMLYEELSGMENLRYVAGLYGIGGELAERVCAGAMEKVGLDPRLARHVGQYSQGMRQRLSLARAMLHQPRILLLDEPFSNVDAASARRMAALLAEMRDSGKCILLITHQAAVIEEVADESIALENGQLVMRAAGIAAAGAHERRSVPV